MQNIFPRRSVLSVVTVDVMCHIFLTLQFAVLNVDKYLNINSLLSTKFLSLSQHSKLYSARGLEWSELSGSHGCPGRLWYRFL